MQPHSIRKLPSMASRFWALAGRRSITECWHWQGWLHTNGYGGFSLRKDDTGDRIAHRLSWIIHYGPIPQGLLVRHRCAQTDCVNPTHLLLGTTADNTRDWRKLGRLSYRPEPRAVPRPSRVERVCQQCGLIYESAPSRNKSLCSEKCRRVRDGERFAALNVSRACSEAVRFWKRVLVGPGCWLWKGSQTPQQYGHFKTDTVQMGAHRYSWILRYGPIPDDLFVLHNCPGGDTPACVNPDHLWLGTAADNARDAAAKGRTAKGDRNGRNTHPEKIARGDNHWMRRMPERIANGKTHPSMRRLRVEIRGEQNGNSRWTAEQVREARRRTEAGERQAAVARDLGMSTSTMNAIVKRRLWPYLD